MLHNCRYGTLCIRENPGCLFIATNRDAVTHLTDAQEWAGLLFSSLSCTMRINYLFLDALQTCLARWNLGKQLC
jgi:phosphoglycolate phosphatase